MNTINMKKINCVFLKNNELENNIKNAKTTNITLAVVNLQSLRSQDYV